MIGQSTDHHFHSSLFPTLGPLFWKRFWDSMAEEKVPLRGWEVFRTILFITTEPLLCRWCRLQPTHVQSLESAESQQSKTAWMGRGQRGKWLPRFHGYSHIVFFFAGFCRRDSTFMVAGCTGFCWWSLWYMSLLCCLHLPRLRVFGKLFLAVAFSSRISTTGIRPRRSWQWYILSYTFKVHQNFKMAPGFGEAEGRWPCHSAPVAFFF